MASVYEYLENLDAISKERYDEKLALLDLNQCPYKFPADKWIDNPNDWPPLSYHHLYHYLIKTPRIYSPEAMENFKSLDAWNFFRSGWVQKIVHFKLDSGVCIMCADVRPSYRTTDKCHKPWVALKSDGTVLAGHCNCMAG
ncbi:uncharacterized protein LOC124807372 [Hydra vulgaris]|uniref:uncharacterized protein LOC124807372 n=1 Tax=Hydra vulgaris TaxID=6087 RepID=UPI001F5F21BE|nr:uncharacterized protein LOC124807372 [Hydra vulgaris]